MQKIRFYTGLPQNQAPAASPEKRRGEVLTYSSVIYMRSPWKKRRGRNTSLDLFNNPVGYFTSLAVFQAKALQNRFF
jgi:hypothetical protein